MTRDSGSSAQTVSAVAVLDLANELLQHSCLNRDDLEGLGAEFNALYLAWKKQSPIQEARLPERLLIDLWDKASESNNVPDLGLRIGSKVNDQAKGVLANWLCHCNTVSEAFDVFGKNIHLLNPSERWERSDCQGGIQLRIYFGSSKYPAVAVDRSMAAAVSWSSALTNTEVKPIAASFTRLRPTSIDAYVDIFGTNVEFEAMANTIVFPKAVFDRPITTANPYLKALLEKQALALGSLLDAESSTSGKVNALLNKDLPRFCQIEAVCDALHLSRSTLYRKLKNEGENHTDLVKKARIDKLKSMSGRLISHDEVAEALGFNDVGSFYRFRKQSL